MRPFCPAKLIISQVDMAGKHQAEERSAGPFDVEQRRLLLEQAERCRRLASALYNRESISALEAMAAGFEKSAAELAGKLP